MPVKEVIFQILLLAYSIIGAIFLNKWEKEEWKSLKPWERYTSATFIIFFWLFMFIYAGIDRLIEKITK